MDLSEFELIGLIAGRADRPARFETGIGDDAAVIRSSGRIVTSVDTAVEGVHFLPGRPPAEAARKAVASSVSDLAAMGAGGAETELLVALGVPAGTPDGFLAGLADGLLAAAREFDSQLAGGDVVASPVFFLSVTAIAHVGDEVPLTGRGGASPGDLVAVTGPVGAAAAGLLLLKGLDAPGLDRGDREFLEGCQTSPRPQLAAGAVLAGAGASAMIDVSDGLAADLAHVARASGVTIELAAEQVPVGDGVPDVARAAGADPVEFALAGGEDYELALAISPGEFEAASSRLAEVTGKGLVLIGKVNPAGPAGSRVEVIGEDGSRSAPPDGHDHFRKLKSR